MDFTQIKAGTKFIFQDGVFTFFAAEYGSYANDAIVVFRVREDRNPKERATEKCIKHYQRLCPCCGRYIQKWFDTHPSELGMLLKILNE